MLADMLSLSLKSLGGKKYRSVLIICFVFFSIFLINAYSMLSNCVIDLEKGKTIENIEYRRIKIYSKNDSEARESNGIWIKDNADKTGIRIYDLADLKNIPNVVSVSESGTLVPSNVRSKVAEIKLCDTKFVSIGLTVNNENGAREHTGGYVPGDFQFITLYDKFDPYDLEVEEYLAKKFPGYQAVLAGDWPKEDNEIMIPKSIAAMWLLSTRPEPDFSEACGAKVELILDSGEIINCVVCGVCDDYVPYYKSELTELEEYVEHRLNYLPKYSAKEDKVTDSTQFGTVYISEGLSSQIYERTDGWSLGRNPILENYLSTVEVTVSSLDKVEAVLTELEKYGYETESEYENAVHLVDRFFFYKNILLLLGLSLAIVTFFQIVNLLIMILDEKRRYMTMLMKLGFSKWMTSGIISLEMVWVVVIGGVFGLFACELLGYGFLALVQHQLADEALYRSVNMSVSPVMALGTVVGGGLVTLVLGLIISLLTIKKWERNGLWRERV